MKITAQTKGGTYTFECGADERLLFAGLRHGLSLPYECASGTCGTCRARVMTGDATLEWSDAPGLKYCKQDKGDVLMCQARPGAECTIRVPSNVLQGEGTALGYFTGTIRNPRRLTADVMDFDVVLDQPMAFIPGQFVLVEAEGIAGGRAYSMVNHARETDTLSLVVKHKPGGGFTDWLFDTAREGAVVRLFGPLGKATFHAEEDKDIVCVAGGSGIAGLMSILANAHDTGYFANHTGRVFFGVRTMADGFYLEELNRFAQGADGNLDVTVALSEEDAVPERHPDFPGIGLATGFVHDAAAAAFEVGEGGGEDVIAYMGGPPPMIDAALRVLVGKAKVPVKNIRYDKFS